MKQGQGQQSNPCYDIVKQRDPDRYFSALLAAQHDRDALMAVYGFAAEVNGISGQVSEPALGEIRLQWWLDQLDGLFGGRASDHPVLSALKPVIEQHDLPHHLFSNYVRAISADLHHQTPDKVGQLEKVFDQKEGAVFQLAARIVDLDMALETGDLQEFAARVVGYTRLLERLAGQLRKGHCSIPSELLEAHKTSAEKVLAAQENNRELALIQARLVHLAQKNLNLLRKEQGRISREMLNVFWPASLCEPVLKTIKRQEYALAPDRGEISQLRRQWILLGKSLFEKI